MSAETVPVQPEPQTDKPVVTPHLRVDEKGVVRITGSRIKVKFIGGEMRYRNATAEDLHDAYPHLPMAALHSAMAYYLDHKEEMDAEMDAGDRYADEMQGKLDNVKLKEELLRRWEAMKPQT